MTTCFDDLRESNEFLNLLLSNINSAVLIVDENLQIHQFNDFFAELFDRSLDTLVEKSFGAFAGCVAAIMENKPCGETSKCRHCILRQSLVQTLLDKVPADKMSLNRVFYINGEAKQKHFEFSTRRIHYQGQDLILVIIYDITDNEQKKIELERKQRQIEQDLKAAAGIQQSLLPDKSPDIPNVDIAWRFEPCQEIGGDIFNIQDVDNRNVGIYMLDVCGHGVPAALIAVSLSQFLQNSRQLLTAQQNGATPASVLDSLNMAFPFERFESYFSIVYAAVDYTKGVLTYSCAGHPPPVILSGNEPSRVLDCHGPVIGIDPDKKYTQAEIKLSPGDKIVFYTDGIIECRNSKGEMFGKNRFYQSLEEHCGKPAPQMADAVYAAAKRFMGNSPPDDDVSIMVVEYVPSGN